MDVARRWRACRARATFASWPYQIVKARCWIERPKENATGHGSGELVPLLMAASRVVARSPD